MQLSRYGKAALFLVQLIRLHLISIYPLINHDIFRAFEGVYFSKIKKLTKFLPLVGVYDPYQYGNSVPS